MKENKEKDTEKSYKMTEKEVFDEVAGVIKDTFIALFQEENNSLRMRFVNGKQFLLTIKEI